jgi:hypothetical protein
MGERATFALGQDDLLVTDRRSGKRRFSFRTETDDGEPITRWHFTFRPDGDATFVSEGLGRIALPDPSEAAFRTISSAVVCATASPTWPPNLERLAALVEN